ncbi:HK97 family phage prohead protease [Rhodococcus aetherivorans]|uniref:HK97 family phage prohead protease n=1 Tax=Rhodococcus aetherivorans TaxID=191292 RepID=UPI00389098C1
MTKKIKLFNTKPKSVDEENKTVRFRISDDSVDRYGERVEQSSWNFKNFLKNPILLWGHNPYDAENVLGTVSDLSVEDDGTYATAHFDEDINPKAALIFKQILKGTLRTVSVGFVPHTIDTEDDIPVLKDNELLELSVVAIPANPNAIALDYKAGNLSRNDATWLMKSMRDEAIRIEQQLKDAPEGQEKQVEEVISKLDTALEAIEATSTKLAELDTKFESVSTELETIKSTVSEVKAKQEETPTPPAKGGDIDQPGAGAEVEIDEDAELTPEQQAEFEAELAEQLKEGDSKE